MSKSYFVTKYKNLKTRNKLIVSYILAVFLPVLFVGAMLTSNMKQMALNRAIDEASLNVEQVKIRVGEVTDSAMKIYYRTVVDREFETLLQKQYDSTVDVFEAFNQYKDFTDYVNLYKEIDYIRFYANNQTILNNGQFFRITGDVENAQWFLKTMGSPGRQCWQYMNKSAGYESTQTDVYTLSFSSIVNGYSTAKPLGMLVVGLKSDYLHSLLANEPFDMVILDGAGTVVAAARPEDLGADAGGIGLAFARDRASGIYNERYGGESVKVIVKTFKPDGSGGDFRILSIVPVSEIEKQAVEAGRWGISIMAVSLSLALALVFVFSAVMSKRVRILSRDMHQVAAGNFDIVPAIDGEDEIGQLSRDMGVMVRSIKELVHEVYEVNLQKNKLAVRQKEIELKVLVNQINPHFLFNALETIRMKAHCRDEEEIADAVKLLGRILRGSLEAGAKPVTIESELDLVRSYLELQKFRFGDRLAYRINADPETLSYRILPLMIQPIAENAVVHGLEGRPGPGEIGIAIKRSGDTVQIMVEDNGAGMGGEELANLAESLKDDDAPNGGIGLKNVQHRIKLFYGEEYGLNIESAKGVGTKITIALPRRD